MAKFEYKNWITNNKYGRLNEQATGSIPTCYTCDSSSNDPSQWTQTSGPAQYVANWCTWNQNTSQTPCYSYITSTNYGQGSGEGCIYNGQYGYTDPSDLMQGQGCGAGTGGASTYRIDAGGCLECPPQYANHPACIYTEPTCGQGGSTSSTGSATPPTPQSGTPGSLMDNPCEEFNTFSRREQKDFCMGCRRDESEPGCECCKGENALQENNYFKYRNNMKESQLRRLIRKEIKSNINEQGKDDLYDPRNDKRDPETPVPITTCAQAGYSGHCHAFQECVNGVGVGNALVFVNLFLNLGPGHYWSMFQNPNPGDTIITNTGIKLIYLGLASNSTNLEQFDAVFGLGSEPTSGTPSTCVQESWDCIEKGPHWKFGTKCVKRNNELGQFQSLPACLEYCNRNQDDSDEMTATDYGDFSFNPMSGGTTPYQDLPSDDETNE